MARFLVVGDANVDIILTGLSDLPVLGQESEATGLSMVLGGSSANCASRLSKLGAEVAFWGKVGTDTFGQFVLREMRANAIDVTGIIQDPEVPTGICVSLSFSAERALVTHLGTIATLQLEDLPLGEIGHYDHLHSGSIFLQHGLRSSLIDLFKAAKSVGLSTSLDCGWDPANRWDLDLAGLLPYVDVFLPNEEEALHLTGTQHVEDALESLSQYDHTVVIKRGKNGTIVWRDNQVYRVPALAVSHAEPTGAGDCFNAGLLYKLYQENQPFPDALQFAVACGAAGASSPGGSSILSSADEILH